MRTTIIIILIALFSCNENQKLEYYTDGKVKKEISINKDNEIGEEVIEYYEGGQVKIKGTMYEGKMVGFSSHFDSLGRVVEKIYYLNGDAYYIEQYDLNNLKVKDFAFPILKSNSDSVSFDENHCLKIKLGIHFEGEVRLILGHVQGGKTHKIDTIPFNNQIDYCLKSEFIGQNQIRGFFLYTHNNQDTTTINNISFKHTFYVVN